ncbi:MAG: methionyl-tRNA formyltransferase [Nitrosomonadales bacterium]|nr:methionyl-tRNA formyltransferase [Nitrosomonadales bacterium]
MKIIFAGTPPFAAAALEALLAHHFDVAAVLTQPDRPAGRGMKLAHGPVKLLAQACGLPVLQPASLKQADIQRELAACAADVMVVAAYGLILPQAVLQLPRFGCLNIHASLLPRWRGAAPIQRAILAGDTETGITIMQMDEGLDTGDMLLKKSCPITPRDTAQTLHDKLAPLGAEAVIAALRLLEQGQLAPEPQDGALATYAPKLTKEEARINWADDARRIACAVRAYNPFPMAYTLFDAAPVKILQASAFDEPGGKPGAVLSLDKEGILVACGKGAVRLEVLQRPNARALPADRFVQGFAVRPGDQLN